MSDYQGWTNSKTWACHLYLTQEKPIYDKLFKIRKERLLTQTDIKSAWYNEKHASIDSWCEGEINWHEIANHLNYEYAEHLYKVNFKGRKAGAIGIDYEISEEFKANDDCNDLINMIYLDYEHVRILSIQKLA